MCKEFTHINPLIHPSIAKALTTLDHPLYCVIHFFKFGEDWWKIERGGSKTQSGGSKTQSFSYLLDMAATAKVTRTGTEQL